MSENFSIKSDTTDVTVLMSLQSMRRKLLDLTARNRLLNFPLEKERSCLRVINTSPNQIYQTLVDDKSIIFIPIPVPTQQLLLKYGYLPENSNKDDVLFHPLPNAKTWAKELGLTTNFELLSEPKNKITEKEYLLLEEARKSIEKNILKNQGNPSNSFMEEVNLGVPMSDFNLLLSKLGYEDLLEFESEIKAGRPFKSHYFHLSPQDDKIQTLNFPNDLDALLRSIFSKAQTAIEETGAGILYFALGFLEWYESDDSNKKMYAPLFTIPVNLERGKLDSTAGIYRYHLSYTGEDILPNLSLREKLQKDFDIALPDINDNTLPEAYLQQVKKIIENNKPRWSVSNYGALTLLNFSKMLMYMDLDPAQWPVGEKNIVNHPVIKRLFTSQSGLDFFFNSNSEYLIDEIEQVHEKYPLIDDADSSQHSALIDAINGKNLVIEGPPGTGKSQTITNLIAAAISQGKKVLFVAEKLSALEVVRRRLEKAGLGDFCLELHSHKSHKRTVLDDIMKRINNRSLREAPEQIDAKISRFEELKAELNDYCHEINQRWKNTDITIHQIFTGAARYRMMLDVEPSELHVSNISGDTFDPVAKLRFKDNIASFVKVVKDFRKQVGECAHLSEHPWYGVNNLDIQPFESKSIIDSLEKWQHTLITWDKEFSNYLYKYALPIEQVNTLSLQQQFINAIENLPIINELLDFSGLKKLNEENKQQLNIWLHDFNEVQAIFQEIKSDLVAEKLKILEDSCLTPEFTDLTKEFGIEIGATFADVAKLISSIEQLLFSFRKSWDYLSDFINSLPNELSSKINPNVQGFERLIELIDIAAQLPPELLKFRHECFDDDGIDLVLDQLSERITVLIGSKEVLKEFFRFDALPSEGILESIDEQLAHSTFFNRCSRSWRQAQKSLLKLSQNGDTSWRKLYQHLPELRQYLTGTALLANENFSRELGDLYQGIDTPIDSLKQLRKWYKAVRSTWGVGFGPNVVFGNKLLSLDSQLIKGIHHLKQQGVVEDIRNSLKKLNEISLKIPEETLLEDASMDLVSIDCEIILVRERLIKALAPLQQWFKNKEMSLQEAKNKSDLLHIMQQKRIKLKTTPAPETLFGVKGQLSIGYDQKNDDALAMISNTLAFNDALQCSGNSLNLIGVIKSFTEKQQLDELYQDLTRVKQFWQNQLLEREKFISATQLDLNMWQSSCADNLDRLISRNQEAISKCRWLNGWLNFKRIAEALREQGLQCIYDAVLNRVLPIEKIEDGFWMAIYDQLAREIVSAKPHLARIPGNSRSVFYNKTISFFI